MYTKKLYAGWADMDFNSHTRNTAYLDKTADVRQMFLIENGFSIEEFLTGVAFHCGTKSSAPTRSSPPESRAAAAG